mmetsp:Transcript_23411/g.70133  ORF Transcript_23411/g.70133 Transcript_23411/m.70133 type:complete len:264 (+) Transcript_23411:211-1002(+)
MCAHARSIPTLIAYTTDDIAQLDTTPRAWAAVVATGTGACAVAPVLSSASASAASPSPPAASGGVARVGPPLDAAGGGAADEACPTADGVAPFGITTKRTVTLSRLPRSNAILTSWVQMCCGVCGGFTASALRTNAATCSLEVTSHSPSHANSTNSSSPGRRCTKMQSGSADTFCLTAGRSDRILYSKSPKARDRARPPSTRPLKTRPPASQIRDISFESVGLWSKVDTITLPPRDSSERESPMLENTICRGPMSTDVHVAPL